MKKTLLAVITASAFVSVPSLANPGTVQLNGTIAPPPNGWTIAIEQGQLPELTGGTQTFEEQSDGTWQVKVNEGKGVTVLTATQDEWGNHETKPNVSIIITDKNGQHTINPESGRHTHFNLAVTGVESDISLIGSWTSATFIATEWSDSADTRAFSELGSSRLQTSLAGAYTNWVSKLPVSPGGYQAGKFSESSATDTIWQFGQLPGVKSSLYGFAGSIGGLTLTSATQPAGGDWRAELPVTVEFN